MKKIKVLINIGYLYHKAAFDPIIELLLNNDKYDVWFSLKHEKKRWFFIDLPYNVPVVKTWEKLGYRFTSETKGFDMYRRAAIETADTFGKAMFEFLAGEEKSHFDILMMRYEYLFGPTGWSA